MFNVADFSNLTTDHFHLFFSFFLFFLFYIKKQNFLQLYSEWNCSHGKLGLLSLGKASDDSHAAQTPEHAGCFSVFVINSTPTWTAGSLTCALMLMRVIAHRGAQTPRLCTESRLWERKKNLTALRNQT